MTEMTEKLCLASQMFPFEKSKITIPSKGFTLWKQERTERAIWPWQLGLSYFWKALARLHGQQFVAFGKIRWSKRAKNQSTNFSFCQQRKYPCLWSRRCRGFCASILMHRNLIASIFSSLSTAKCHGLIFALLLLCKHSSKHLYKIVWYIFNR